MTSLPQVATVLAAALTDVSDEVAHTSGFCQRRSKLTATVFVQILVLGWWQHAEATLAQLCQVAVLRGVRISPQGLDQRFTEGAASLLRTCLEAVLSQMASTTVAVPPLLARFSAVLILDSTTITLPDGLASHWPGCGGRVTTNTQAALKCSALLDLRRGSLAGLELRSGRTQDRATALQQAAVPTGALRIADQGYWSLKVLRAIAAGTGYFLSRYHSQTTVHLAGKRLDLPRWLAQQDDVVDVAVTLGTQHPLPVRFLAIHVPHAVGEARRRRIREAARAGGHGVPKTTLALADWTILVTNAPATLLSAAEAEVLRRLRWQVELVFKLWKQHGQVDASRSAKPWRILCEVYAKLLALVLQHWVLLLGDRTFGTWRLVHAAATIRAMVVLIATTIDQPRRLHEVLQTIASLLAAIGPPNKRRTRPSAAQLLADPSLVFA